MKIKIFTDGACSGNPGPGGAAFVAIVNQKQTYECAGGYRLTTNNRMEMLSVMTALTFAANLIEKSADKENTVTILSDSQVVVGTLLHGWKRKKNNDLWNKIDAALGRVRSSGATLHIQKVEGHAGVKYNEQADRLAVRAYKEATHVDEVYEKEANAVSIDMFTLTQE